MVDLQTVCCMCGDVGFSDKLFRCSKCRRRFQHSYCSNYYGEFAEPIKVCDWCQYEERNNLSPRQILGGSSSSSRSSGKSADANTEVRSAYSGERIKRHDGGGAPENSTGKIPSPRTATRRYKLLKDVMC